MAKLIRSKSFTEIQKNKYSKSQLIFNVKYMLNQAIGRLNRLSKHFSSNAQIFRNNEDIKKINVSDINDMTKIELSSLLSRLNKFTQAESSKIKGYNESRQKTIESLNENGYDFINKDNLDDFLEFMDDFKNSKDAEVYGSDDVVKYYEQAERLGISKEDLKENLDIFQEHFREIEELNINELRNSYGEDLSSRDLLDALYIKY